MTHEVVARIVAGAIGGFFIVGAFKATGLYSGHPPRGNKTLYPITNAARVILFLIGALLLSHAMTGWTEFGAN